ncbi:MAG: FAD-dependent oxidoreductase [Proteobacteria bacterium]|nr:FAD-dependent oxidoreductase [Pseudomonadota bacterium]MBU1388474.1 FAD-dependent oxidoreductase [Pseudomonadota bacterium]MBU1542702.1 FAD-dependent oxidoreductase [Pseudomonadota bacterium]
MRKQLILIGGGHAHMMVLENIGRFVEKGYKVTVIAPSFYHYYSGMGPGMLGGTYQPSDIRFATEKVVRKQGGVFVNDSAVRIDARKKQVHTASNHVFDYDVLSVNAGSYVPMQKIPDNAQNIYPVKPIEKLMEAAEKLSTLFKQRKITVSIIGGGPSSAEIAGNVWQLAGKTKKWMPEIQILAGRKFMARFSEKVRTRVIKRLEKRGVQILETGYVKDIQPDMITLDSGQTLSTDFIFMATGVKPSVLFEDSHLPIGPDKGLLVNTYLQSVSTPDIFGGGDCICFQDQPLDKVGVYAVRQNPILLHNILAQLEGKELVPFEPGPEYLLIFNLGGRQGVLKKKSLVFSGQLAFWIKDYIDRKFMKKFQAIETLL